MTRTGSIVALSGLLLAAGCAAPAPGPPPDVAALMRGIAAEPYRYGGALQGSVPGVAGAVDQPPVHLSLGLDAPAPDGTLRGHAILFDAGRRLVDAGPVSGRLGPGFSAGTSPCRLRLALGSGTVELHGICTADTLSGEVVAHPPRPDLLRQIAFWWGDRDGRGRYWLDRSSFDPRG